MKMQKSLVVIVALIGGLALGCGDDGPLDDIGGGDGGFDAVEPADNGDDPGTTDNGFDTGHDTLVVTDQGNDSGDDVVEPVDNGGDIQFVDNGGDDVEPPDVVPDDFAGDDGNDVTADTVEDAMPDEGGDSGADVPEDTSTPDVVDTDTTVTDLPQDTPTTDLPAADDGSDAAPDPGQPPEPTEINGIAPESAVENTAFTLTVTGTGLDAGMTVRITGDNAITAGYEASPDSVLVLDGGRRISASFPASNGLIRGYYRVELVDGGSVADSLSGFRILAAGATAPTVTGVTPDTAKTGRDRMVTVTGTGFAAGAAVVLAGYGQTYECSYVEVANSTTLTAVVQAGTSQIPVGGYDFWVVNPDGLAGKWTSAFTITDVAPPAIDAITPLRAGNATSVTMTVTGRDFQDGAVVSLVVGGAEDALATTVITAGTVLGATVPSGLAAGIYPVRVTNPDDQFDTFYFYQVSNNSPGSLTTFEAMISRLNIPRWQHGLDAMVDGMGHGFLVATGGLDSAGIPLDDVEISQVGPNGEPGTWFVPVQTDPLTGQRIVNRMAEPRSGAATVRVGKTLFVAGGRSLPDAASPAVESIETARMLTGSGAPRTRAPHEADGGGFLPAGRWLYRVSAVTPAGETLASSSVSYRGEAGALTISWEPVKDAVGYNVYRCAAANLPYGSEVAVAWMAPATSRSFTDDGAGYLTPSPYGLDGTVYPDNPGWPSITYSYVVTSVSWIDETTEFESVPGAPLLARVDGDSGVVSLAWNDVPAAASYRVYRSRQGGDYNLVAEVPAGTLYYDDTLGTPALAETPPAAVMPLPTGSLSLFDYARGADGQPLLLNIPREGARATYVETQFDETDPDALVGVMFVIGGRTGFEPLPSSESSVESIRFFIDGSLDGPTVEAVGLRTGRSFFGLGNSQDRLENLAFEDDDDDDPVTPDCPDVDGDGFFDAECGGTDCDDTNLMINPAAWEDLQNGVDDNCDGLVDVPTQGWEFTGGGGFMPTAPFAPRALDENPEPVFLIAMLGNDDVVASGDTGLDDIEAVGVDLYTGELLELNQPPSGLFTLQVNADNSSAHGINVALYQKFLFSFMGVGSENLGQVPGNLIAQSKRFPFCPPPGPGDPGDSSFGCPGYASWTYADLAGVKRTSANATVSGGLGYYGLSRAFGYIYLVAGVGSGGISDATWRVLQ